MDLVLYRAAMEGSLEVLMQQKQPLEAQMTPNNNTVLHVAALFNNNSTLMKELLAAKPLLLCRVNTKDETSLHIAAREGHNFTVHALIECAKEMEGSELESGIRMAKEMLRMVNKAGNTALHEAVRNNHINIVDLLVEEDPEFSHPPNKSDETPLYIAAERGFDRIVSKILNTCTSPAYSGPDGRTALHGAVTRNSLGCTTKLLQWKGSLMKESDIYGWTPLHYAAYYGYTPMVRELLITDKSVAYLPAHGDNKKTALHIAASWNRTEVMKELISHCPDCWEMVDIKGQNILHFASHNQQCEAINFILQDSKLNSLINQTDEDGNTPLHLLAASGINTVFMRGFEHVCHMIKDPRVDKDVFNNIKLTPLDIIYGDSVLKSQGFMRRMFVNAGARRSTRNTVNRAYSNLAKVRQIRIESTKPQVPGDSKMGDTHLIVAAFIATVTFAAGFTVPGGYDGNQGPNEGMAVLTRAAAFKAFVIADSLAVVLSTCAVFLFFISVFYSDPDKITIRYTIAHNIILLAVGAMLVAFMTGLYAVLGNSLGLAISVCLIILFSFLFCFFILMNLVRDLKPRYVRVNPFS